MTIETVKTPTKIPNIKIANATFVYQKSDNILSRNQYKKGIQHLFTFCPAWGGAGQKRPTRKPHKIQPSDPWCQIAPLGGEGYCDTWGLAQGKTNDLSSDKSTCSPNQKTKIGSAKNPLNLYLDSEWHTVIHEGVERNCVLSIQWLAHVNGVDYLIIQEIDRPQNNPRLHGLEYRISFNTALAHALACLIDLGVVDYQYLPRRVGWSDIDKSVDLPIHVNVVVHAGKADFSNFFREYDSPLYISRAVQGGTVSNTPHPVLVETPSRNNTMRLSLNIRDTMCHAPGGRKSLSALAESVGVSKIDIGGYISHMNDLLVDDYPLYLAYAAMDVYILMLYISGLYGHNSKIPVTAASYGARKFIDDFIDMFGLSGMKQFRAVVQGFVEDDRGDILIPGAGGKLVNKKDVKYVPYRPEYGMVDSYARQTCHGGLNQCFRHGYYGGETWYDIDLRGAYPTCMSLIKEIFVDLSSTATPPIQFNNQRLSVDFPLDYDDVFFALVDFSFPEGTYLPCIPVKYNNSLITPLKAERVYATGPEILMALSLGAEVYLHSGILMPSIDHVKRGSFVNRWGMVIKEYIDLRKKQPKGSLLEKHYKTVANSIWGKSIQGVNWSTVFNPEYDRYEEKPESALTTPYIGALTSAIVRAYLSAIINQLVCLGYKVLSVTTDGLITNAPLDVVMGLSAYGLTDKIKQAAKYLHGDENILDVKHVQQAVYSIATRANVSPDPEGVLARGGYKTSEVKGSDEDRRAFMLEVLGRKGKLVMTNTLWPTTKDLVNDKTRDLIPFSRDVHKRMEYCYKRKPLLSSAEMRTVSVYGMTFEVLAFDTQPFTDLDEYGRYRQASSDVTPINDAKTLAYVDLKATNTIANTYKLKTESMARYYLRQYLTGWRAGKWDIALLEGQSLENCVKLINMVAYEGEEVTLNDLKNWGRRDRQGKIIDYSLLTDVSSHFARQNIPQLMERLSAEE